jgi:iron-sulfur cluster repair protein YtfE (RIC family)
MTTRTKHRSVYEQALREHEALEKKLAYLNLQLERREVPLEEIVKLLDGLRHFFVCHFRNEEQGGLFETVVERAPHLSRLADKLTHEHGELLERLDGLLKFARRGTGQPLCWRMLGLRLRDLTEKLHQHESEENGMLQMAYADDLGTKD